MIQRSLIYLILLLAIYSTLTHILHWPSKSLTQWEDNERLISKFLFSENHSKINTVIVGSSMALRMTVNENPYKDTVYNLSLGGQGLFEGLEILKRSGFTPKYLLIESNVIYRDPRQNYAASFFTPGVYQLKKWLPGFRQEYRPITFSQYLYYGIKGRWNHFIQHQQNQNSNISDSHKTFDTILSTQNTTKQTNLDAVIQNYNKTLRDTDWTKINQRLKSYIKHFVKKGSTICFFEMPSEQLLLESGLNTYIRKMLANSYPNQSFIKAHDMETTDGVHLKPEEAHEYLGELLIKIYPLKPSQ